MKNLLLILGIMVAGFVTMNFLNHSETPTQNANGSSNIIMYSTSNCGYCKRARNLFAEKNIDYVECNVEKSPQCNQTFAELKGRGVPLFNIKGKIIHGYNREQLLATLKAENIPTN